MGNNGLGHFEVPKSEVKKCNVKLGYPWVAGYSTANSVIAQVYLIGMIGIKALCTFWLISRQATHG